MTTLFIAFGSFIGFIIAYHTYGRWLSRKIFGLTADATVPSTELRDDVDFIPTKKEVIGLPKQKTDTLLKKKT